MSIAGGTAPGALTYTSAGTLLNVGIQTSKVAAAATNNYNAALKHVTVLVNKALLTVTANNIARIQYSGIVDIVPTSTATFTGFVNGENLVTRGVTGSPVFTTSATLDSECGWTR